jgi:hypothetical protein
MNIERVFRDVTSHCLADGDHILNENSASIFCPESIMSVSIKMITVYNMEGVTAYRNNILH